MPLHTGGVRTPQGNLKWKLPGRKIPCCKCNRELSLQRQHAGPLLFSWATSPPFTVVTTQIHTSIHTVLPNFQMGFCVHFIYTAGCFSQIYKDFLHGYSPKTKTRTVHNHRAVNNTGVGNSSKLSQICSVKASSPISLGQLKALQSGYDFIRILQPQVQESEAK